MAVQVRQGALQGLAELLPALAAAPECPLPAPEQDALAGLVGRIEAARLLRGRGAELMRATVCRWAAESEFDIIRLRHCRPRPVGCHLHCRGFRGLVWFTKFYGRGLACSRQLLQTVQTGCCIHLSQTAALHRCRHMKCLSLARLQSNLVANHSAAGAA